MDTCSEPGSQDALMDQGAGCQVLGTWERATYVFIRDGHIPSLGLLAARCPLIQEKSWDNLLSSVGILHMAVP